MIVLAHLSDPHYDGHPRNVQRVDKVLSYLGGLPTPPDAILVTGDITDTGSLTEYAQARASLIADVPLLLCPGNHDDRYAYRVGLLAEAGDTAPINSTVTIGNTVIAMADSSMPGEAGGAFEPQTIDWLRGVLDGAAADVTVVIAFHHPPVQLFSPIVDPIRLDDDGTFEDLVAGDYRIAALLCGHAHTSAATTFGGKPLLVAPSVASVLGPAWEGREHPVIDYDVPPSLAFHVIDDDRRITTHYRVVV